jgi:hypothetical protein
VVARLDLALEELCAHDRAAIGLPGAITIRLSGDILGEPFALCFAEGAKRFVVESGIKSETRRVQILDDRDIQALLRDQDFDVSAAE